MATVALRSDRPSHRLHQSFPPASFTSEAMSSNPLLSPLEREAILSLPRRTLSLRRKVSSNSLFGLKSRDALNSSPKSATFKPQTWVRRVSDAFQITRRDSNASSSTSSLHRRSSSTFSFAADIAEDAGESEARLAFDETERPTYELCLDSISTPSRLRRQASDESFQCRGLSTSSSTEFHYSPSNDFRKLDLHEDSIQQHPFQAQQQQPISYCTLDFAPDAPHSTNCCDGTSVLHTRTSFSNFSVLSGASGSSLTSTSDYALPITPSSVERPLRPKTRPPSLSLNDDEILALEDIVEPNSKFSALGIYDTIIPSQARMPTVSPSDSLLAPPAFSAPMGGPRRAASCDGRYGFGYTASAPARHAPRTEAPAADVDDVRLWVRFVGLPSDEALDSISVSAKLSSSSLKSSSQQAASATGSSSTSTTTATSPAAASGSGSRRTNNPPVAPFEIHPLSTVAQLKERLADMVLDRFGMAVSADELTVSMHSIVNTAPALPACSSAIDGDLPPPMLAAATASPTLRLGCSGASSDAGTATPHMMTAAWSSTASLPSLIEASPALGVCNGSSGCGNSFASARNGSVYSLGGSSIIGRSGRPVMMAAATAAAAAAAASSSSFSSSSASTSRSGSTVAAGVNALLPPAPPSTIVTELRRGESTLWGEGVEDGFTLVARIRSLAFF